MSLLIIDILITNLVYILTGKYFYSKYLGFKDENAIQNGILGIVIVSFISLFLNFFSSKCFVKVNF